MMKKLYLIGALGAYLCGMSGWVMAANDLRQPPLRATYDKPAKIWEE